MKGIAQTLASIMHRQTAILLQLCTGHCLLNLYLHQFKKIEALTCTACNQADKMIKHYLLYCSVHERQ
ncbi:hypothetical protein J132_00987 [Termitomyces sp. J132]|nr:hypothetical protein J132_00987 [Termitomyces sp. J132]